MVSLSDFDTPPSAPIPPQNLEAEESVLGAALLSPGAIQACRDILQDDGREFYRESHARIWRAILALTDAGEPVDVITITDRLEETGELDDIGGRVRLHELAQLVPATANASHYARVVVENAQLRDFIYIGGNLARLGWDRPGSIEDLRERALGLFDQLLQPASRTGVDVETWAQFERSATENVPTIVDGLWPAGGLGFIAAPPKKGKTWVGLSLAIAVATGSQFLASFQVEKPEPVVYLALEGHRAAIRGRIGCLARGLGVDPYPEHGELANLHIIYKPRGLNLADPAWVRTIRDTIQHVGAKLLIVDVLRAAAVVKENSNDEFRDLLRVLQPLQETTAIAMLHHFGKLTEISRDRSPGERMAGAGAMYGAFDVGVFITASEDGGRTLRLEFETRDLANPDTVGIHLAGDPNGRNGGFIYTDAATWQIQEAPDGADVKAPAHEIATYVLEKGGDVERREVEGYFAISADTLSNRLGRLWVDHQIELVVGRGRGARSRLVHRPEQPADQQLNLDSESHDPVSDESKLSAGRDFTPSKTNDSEKPHESNESIDLDDLSQNEYADLQGEFSYESSRSPTESQTTAGAELPLRSDFDIEDDVA